MPGVNAVQRHKLRRPVRTTIGICRAKSTPLPGMTMPDHFQQRQERFDGTGVKHGAILQLAKGKRWETVIVRRTACDLATGPGTARAVKA